MRSFSFLFFMILVSCHTQTDYYNIATFKNSQLQAVIEIPAGNHLKIEYNHEKQEFMPDQLQGKDRYISFLGYPGNYGFIPSTYSDPKSGGDGDPLDILVLGDPVASGSVQPVIPIGLLKLIDDGELDYKIIAIPAKEKHRHVKATTWKEFNSRYPAAREILGLWFTHYDENDETKVEGWGDEKEAFSEIKKWQINKQESSSDKKIINSF